MKKKLMLYSLMILMSCVAVAQNGIQNSFPLAPEDETEIKQRLIKNKKILKTHALVRGVTTYIPVKIHLVADDEGAGRLSEDDALDMLCILNEEYEDSEIQFYLKDGTFNYIESSLIYYHEDYFSGGIPIWTESNENSDPEAINIFVANEVGSFNSYYISIIDVLYIRKSHVRGKSVLSLPMGHFFSLLKTYSGWGSFDEFCEGSLDASTCNGGIQIENQSGNNCDTAGDLICDTPPDYYFTFCPSTTNCEFNGEVYDCEGEQVFPMEQNMMGNYNGCADYEFTQEQSDLMNVDLLSPERAYCNPGILPNLAVVNELAVATSPINGEVRPYNAVELKWDPVPGATHYLVELDRFDSFSWMPLRRVVTTNSTFIANYCMPNAQYFWRIRPFNEYSTCESAFGDNFQFETNAIASKVETVEGVNHWSVRPNPANSSEAIFVDVEALQAMDATVNMYSVTGQLISSSKQLFSIGNNIVELATNNLTTGLYMVSIETKTGVTTKRVVIR